MSGELTIQCPTEPKLIGAYKISWPGEGEATFVLRENGRVVYRGKDGATTLTGRREGSYRYVVERTGNGSAISQPCEVTVAPPSPLSTWLLFCIGLLVFSTTVVSIVLGHRAHGRGELQ